MAMVNQYPLGLNINLESPRDWEHLVATCKVLRSKYHLVRWTSTGNGALDARSARRLYDDIGDDSLRLVVRIFSEKQGNWREYDVDKYVNYCAQVATILPNVIFDAPSNEPGVSPDQIAAFVKNQVELIQKFKARGLHYAAMCFGVGGPRWEDVLTGQYDDILRQAEFISEHHYAPGWLEAGSGVPYDVLLKPQELRPHWREKWPIEEGHYLVRRSDFWVLRCREIEISVPEFIITECVLDQIPDTVTWLNNRYNGAWDKLRAEYGLKQYNNDLRGLNTYEHYYKVVFPELTYDQALAKIHIHYVEDCLYVDYIGGACIFAWDTLWDVPEGFDASIVQRHEFFTILADHARTYVKPSIIVVPDTNESEVIQMSDTTIRAVRNQIRIREKPSTIDSPQIGWVLPDTYRLAQISEKMWISDGYIWRKIEYDGHSGYAAFRTVNGSQLIETQIVLDTNTDDIVSIARSDFEMIQHILKKYE